MAERFGKRPATRIVIEAGTHSPCVSRLLESLGHGVIVANARKVRLISKVIASVDRLDARMLAKLGRLDVSLLCPPCSTAAPKRKLTWRWCGAAMPWWLPAHS